MSDYTEADLARAREWLDGQSPLPREEHHRNLARLIASVRAEGKKEGRRAGLEDAAAWHEKLAGVSEECAKLALGVHRADHKDMASNHRGHAFAIRALADQPAAGAEAGGPADGWIAVEHRLPEMRTAGGSDVVLAHDGNAYYLAQLWPDGVWDDADTGHPIDRLTHWMPLPEPPRAAGKSADKEASDEA